MIDNNVSGFLNRYFNRSNGNEAGSSNADIAKKLQDRQDAIRGRKSGEASTEGGKKTDKKGATDTADIGGSNKSKNAAQDTTSNMTAEERRQAELKAILDKINREEAQRNSGSSSSSSSNSSNSSSSKADEKSNVITVVDPETGAAQEKDKSSVLDFLNDMPLFNEFKTGLMDAFKQLDAADSGSISAQYELNYTTMQAVANSAGGYDYKETSLNIKIDLNYVKAAGGKNGTQDLQNLLGNATDMDSLLAALKGGQTQGAQSTAKPKDVMAGLQDYFSPESTANRIVDFATSFFPLSDAFKEGGDTEEAREKFAGIMRDAVQKGFDQAMGTLGKVPEKTQQGIDKTHELTFKGIDDFVKNGMNRNKEEDGVYSSLQELFFSAQVSYSEKTVSVRNGYGYGSGDTSGQQTSGVNTEA